MGGKWLKWYSYIGNAISIKKELLVFTAAINPITVVTNILYNLISLVLICI